jgi:hypothetical protein
VGTESNPGPSATEIGCNLQLFQTGTEEALRSEGSMGFVTAWKAVSISLTGVFGILGLLTEFKTKEGGITRWGYVSLVGILISTTFGVAAQLRESNDSASKALALAEQSKRVLDGIQRQVYAIGEPTLHIKFTVPCGVSKFKKFCGALRRQSSRITTNYGAVPSGHWEGWPEHLDITGDLTVFRDEMPLVHYSFTASRTKPDSAIDALAGSEDAAIYLHTKPMIVLNHGFKSLVDLPGTSFVLELSQQLADLTVETCNFETKDGELISLDMTRTNRTRYSAHFGGAGLAQ